MCELELVELIEEISVYSKVENNKWLLYIDKIDLDFSCKLYRFDGSGKSSIFPMNKSQHFCKMGKIDVGVGLGERVTFFSVDD